MNERAIRLGSDESLAAVVTEPGAGAPPAPAVLWLSAGFVHRIGPNRLYVTAARQLAELGFVSVRFDFSGIGDSPPRRDRVAFDEGAVRETREVIDWLEEHLGIGRVVVAGICSGASVALRTACCDARVVGAALVNVGSLEHSAGWNVFVGTRAESKRYWKTAAFSAERWRRALSGNIHYRRLATVLLRELKGRLKRGGEVASTARRLRGEIEALQKRGVRLLVMGSEADPSLEQMSVVVGGDVRRMKETDTFAVQVVPHGDHEMTLLPNQRCFLRGFEDWARGFLEQDTARAGPLPLQPSTL